MYKRQILSIAEKFEAIQNELETIRDAMQEVYDNRSEKWQESEKGEEAQSRIETIEQACNDVENTVAAFNSMFDF